MSSRTLVCTGCGCLCDDVVVQLGVDSGVPGRIENACARGAAYLQAAFGPARRAAGRIRRQACSPEDAIDEAARLLSKAERRLIFGLDSSTLEAQAVAIELARKLGAAIDGASSFAWGPFIERIVRKELPSCSLSEVKDKADLLLYWGANPTATHPRHLSRHTYYAYSEFNPAGWYPQVTLATVDVRQTELTAMSKPALRIKPGEDRDLIAGVLGELPPDGQAGQLSELIRKSRFCTLLCGLGLAQALDGDLEAFTRMVRMLGQSVRMAVIPMIVETSMIGFARQLYELTGYVNSVSFAAADGSGRHAGGREFSFAEQVREQAATCILIVGSDPFSTLPQSLLDRTRGANISIICLDHFPTLTTEAADVVVPVGVPGVDSGGTLVRMDGDRIALADPVEDGALASHGAPAPGSSLSEEAALWLLLEKVQP